MVGQLGGFRQAQATQLLPHADEEGAALVLLAEEVPAYLEGARRVEVERLGEQLLQRRDGHPGDARGEAVVEGGRLAISGTATIALTPKAARKSRGRSDMASMSVTPLP